MVNQEEKKGGFKREEQKEDHVNCKTIRSRKMSYAYGGNKTQQEKEYIGCGQGLHRNDEICYEGTQRSKKERPKKWLAVGLRVKEVHRLLKG